ncbi:MAG TPA: hypothetical protein DCS28_03600 [Candidatus Moranbacteria bacterium]|nr:hypothetical protein [Candidatus Moranbacteria bacterium]HAT75097.1 hypothetical protein [Candidatus Moranbacteria bacterium]
MPNKTKIFLISFLAFILLVVSGCGCRQTAEKYRVDLEVWGVLDDSDAYAEIFKNYRDINPNVGNIIYKKQRIETYKKDLVDALASGKGPDIFLIHNTWLAEFSNKISAAPKEILTEQKFRKDFADVCANDFIADGAIYAVPLSVDSLALYYNKDLFNAAGITAPPKTWEEFVILAEKLTKINNQGGITQSGAALGTAYNINRSTDILNLLMLQNGVQMRDERGQIDFGRDGNAVKALDFYTQFAKAGSSSYSWNPVTHYSIDAFSEGSLAMMLNYSWQMDVIKSKAPKLNFTVAEIPQVFPGAPVNYANYWAFAVANNKTIEADPKNKTTPVSNDIRITEAWKLLTYLTTKAEMPIVAPASSTMAVNKPIDLNFDPAGKYLEITKQPAARKDLIEKQKNDVDLNIFAKGNLTAKSWKQIDAAATEFVFAEMIDQVNKGAATVADALQAAGERLTRAEAK